MEDQASPWSGPEVLGSIRDFQGQYRGYFVAHAAEEHALEHTEARGEDSPQNHA